MECIILVHGGAGDIPDSRVPGKISGVKLAANVGYKVLNQGGNALDAVEAAIRVMEDDENFNAGFGSVLNLAGEVEMGASIMNGTDLGAGAVALLQDVANPISVARRVMECTPHVLLGAHGASKFARDQGFPIVSPASLVSDYARQALDEFKRTGYVRTEIGGVSSSAGGGGTVGAVAVDRQGHVAAATSTGGMNGKMVGRIGDTPLIGSGTYADDGTGAVSTTGHGETILKYCLAHSIIKEMELGKTAAEATEHSVQGMTDKLHNTAGAIAVSRVGDVGVWHTSRRMAWAYQRTNQVHYGIEQGQHEIELV
ncbi:uncharacterized protein CBL_08958 [Carabus blaptoides fortunei]